MINLCSFNQVEPNPGRLKSFFNNLWCRIGVTLMISPMDIAAELNTVIVVGRV